MTARLPENLRRLAIVNQREGGGATAVAVDLEERARAHGFETAVFPDAETPDLPSLLRALDRFRPDVIHAHCFYNAYPASTLRVLGEKAPTVFTLHDVYPVNQFGTECWECDRNRFCWACPALRPAKRWYPNYRVRSRMSREMAWRGVRAHLVYPTAWIRRRVAKTALADLPYRIIMNAVDAAKFAPRDDARARLELDDRPLIVTAGNMYSADDDRKGHAVMFSAFDEFVRLAMPEARLAVVGRVEGLTPPRETILLGERPQEETALWYAAADVYAHPALGDNLPLTVLEASAVGAAVVASRVGGVPEVVDDGVTGLLVPPGDRARLGLSCVELLRDRARAKSLGVAARRRMIERHAPETFWKAHLDLYESVTGGRRVTQAGRAAP